MKKIPIPIWGHPVEIFSVTYYLSETHCTLLFAHWYLHLFENIANFGIFSCFTLIALLYHVGIAENEAPLVMSYISMIPYNYINYYNVIIICYLNIICFNISTFYDSKLIFKINLK